MFERITALGRWPLALMLPVLMALTIALPASQGRTSAPEADLVSVIVQTTDSDAAATAIESAGGIVDRTFTLIPATEARIPADAVNSLVATDAIRAIIPNASVEATDYSLDVVDADTSIALEPAISDGSGSSDTIDWSTIDAGELGSVFPQVVQADDVWRRGVTGQGVGIAIIDTGVTDSNGTDFRGRVVARVARVGTSGVDEWGHGTHVAGVAAGNGSNSSGLYMGIAPRASIISVKVGTPDQASVADVIAGIEWVVNNQAAYNIRVINLSLTSAVPMSYLKDPLDAAVEAAWFDGLVVVVAAGNRGSEDYTVDHAPANDPFVISVGAYTDNGTLTIKDDYLKDWSSRGETHDGFAKPEIIAPGSRLIASVGKSDSILYAQYPENRVGDHYFRMGGTSTAAPVVSGIAALILQEHPELTPDQVKSRIVTNSDRLRGSDAPGVDAYEAVFGPDRKPANHGVRPSFWINPTTGDIDPTTVDAEWDGVTWDGVTWDGVTWDGVTWDGVTWDGVTWDGVTWDGVTWDGVTWDGVTWDGVTWDGVTWDAVTWDNVIE